MVQSQRTRLCTELWDTLLYHSVRRHCCEFCASRCKQCAQFSILAELIKSLTSSMSDRNPASISNESSGDTILRVCFWVCPQGQCEMGHRDALKLWLAPRVKQGVIRSAPWGLAQYTAPKRVSCFPSFPLITDHLSTSALISSMSLCTALWDSCSCMLERNLVNRRHLWFTTVVCVYVCVWEC